MTILKTEIFMFKMSSWTSATGGKGQQRNWRG